MLCFSHSSPFALETCNLRFYFIENIRKWEWFIMIDIYCAVIMLTNNTHILTCHLKLPSKRIINWLHFTIYFQPPWSKEVKNQEQVNDNSNNKISNFFFLSKNHLFWALLELIGWLTGFWKNLWICNLLCKK